LVTFSDANFNSSRFVYRHPSPANDIDRRSFSDPMGSTSPALGNDTDTDKLEYARALIHALVLERDLEKAKRQQEFKIWKAKTAILEAQLALREAELESCITHTQRCFEPQLAEELVIELDTMSVSDSTNILQLVGAKNKFLDVVNSDLSEQVNLKCSVSTFSILMRLL